MIQLCDITWASLSCSGLAGAGPRHIQKRLKKISLGHSKEYSCYVRKECSLYVRKECSLYVRKECSLYVRKECSLYVGKECSLYVRKECSLYVEYFTLSNEQPKTPRIFFLEPYILNVGAHSKGKKSRIHH